MGFQTQRTLDLYWAQRTLPPPQRLKAGRNGQILWAAVWEVRHCEFDSGKFYFSKV